ncbi:MAG: hypothetical protein OJF51_003811 [Nitrospira sp.]|jgi:inner membrane protein|nr:MAG: hypothetical protein OJF51_003811 [Nitrospira sp.]
MARAAQVGIFVYLFLCAASHGVLDALTDGGFGVAFFSPFDTSRYFFSARPVAVSPLGINALFAKMLRVLAGKGEMGLTRTLPDSSSFVHYTMC